MDEIKCEALLAAVELGSLTAAAEKLGYSQSGVTRMIASLEEEVGFPLVVRSKKGVVPTANGQTMIAPLREIVRAQRTARQISSDICGVVTGTMTIGTYFSIAALILPQILKDFELRYPKVRVILQEGGNTEMKRWLTERSVDLCFCAEPSGADCDWIPVFRDHMVAWLPKDHPLAESRSFPVERLGQEPLIRTLVNHDTDQDRLLEKLHIHPDVRYSTKDGFTTYNMAVGLGISFNQSLISRKWNGEVAEVPLDPPQYISLGLALPALKEASPATRRFIDCVRARKELWNPADRGTSAAKAEKQR